MPPISVLDLSPVAAGSTEAQALRDENADLRAELETARAPVAVGAGLDRLETTLPASADAPATARAALTRWLTGHVPEAVLDDARLLASELIANSLLHAELVEEASLRLAVQLPLYLAGGLTALGVARIAMGIPLFAVGIWLSWLILRPRAVSADH